MRPPATGLRIIRNDSTGLLVGIGYADGYELRVRYRPGKGQPWRCPACGPQEYPDCPHVLAADLAAQAQEVLTTEAGTTKKEHP